MSGARDATGRVGVVVVHFGNPAPTRACLAALRADRSVESRRVAVVDNSDNLSWDGLANELILRSEANRGYGAAANTGVAALGAEPGAALVILNNDVEVCPGFLGAAVRAVEPKGVGAASGPLYLDHAGGTLWFAGGAVNWALGTVKQSTSPLAARTARDVGFLSGAAIAVNPQAWREVGGFDVRYFLYHEDLDLCLRLRRAGYTLRFEPAMSAVHRLGVVTGSGRRSPLYLEHMSASRLRPFRPLAFRLYLAALHTGYVLARSLAILVTGDRADGQSRVRALFRGHFAALSQILEGPRESSS